jgi:hypothetical protein
VLPLSIDGNGARELQRRSKGERDLQENVKEEEDEERRRRRRGFDLHQFFPPGANFFIVKLSLLVLGHNMGHG